MKQTNKKKKCKTPEQRKNEKGNLNIQQKKIKRMEVSNIEQIYKK